MTYEQQLSQLIETLNNCNVKMNYLLDKTEAGSKKHLYTSRAALLDSLEALQHLENCIPVEQAMKPV